MKAKLAILIVFIVVTFNQMACSRFGSPKPLKEMTFPQDVAFLEKHVEVITLGQGPGKPKVAIVPAYQGRVMTSTVGGSKSPSHGWINRELIEAGRNDPHINAYGGEDRFWLGPEGGQFSIFFKKGDPFDLEHWQTPALIDTRPYEVIKKKTARLLFVMRQK